MLYISGAADSSRRVLERIYRLMADAGIGKQNLLTAQVILSHSGLLDEHNGAWNDWVDPHNPPLRACKTAPLERPDALVQILVTAAK